MTKGVRKNYPALPAQQRGIALMMVILVFALVTILSVGMYNRQGLFIQQAATIAAQTQAYEYARASETYGKRLLKADWDEDKKENKFIDDLEQVSSALFVPVEEAFLEAQFNDVQGKFNLNDLVGLSGAQNEVMVARFKRLLNRLALETVKVELLIDWIDDNQEPSGFDGSEDGDYLGLNPPYRTGGQPMVHPSELRMLLGVSDEDYSKLLEFVTVLPRGKAEINVNTAPEEILQSLVEGLSDQQAKELVAVRENGPWESVEKFAAEPVLKGLNFDQSYLSVSSRFFGLATRITLAERVVRLNSLIYRNPEDGQMLVLLRDQGQKYLITKEQITL
ncbi:MAG: general secretion pathway protein GspK [Oleiphilus sp.]|nr:MAG: general secretion pathway protein GspK [Oleiphilus sp.]